MRFLRALGVIGKGFALVGAFGVGGLGVHGADRLLCPPLYLSSVVHLPHPAVPHEPLLPGVAVAEVRAVLLDQALGVAQVGEVNRRSGALG